MRQSRTSGSEGGRDEQSPGLPDVRQAKPGHPGNRGGGKDELKPSGCKSHPAKASHQPVASVAWCRVTATAKRTQRVDRPCD